MNEDFLVNINGELFRGDKAQISVFDRGFLFGDSVYESTRTFNQKAFRIHKHLERLMSSAHKINLPLTLSLDTIEEEVKKTILSSGFKDALLRIIITRGTNLNLDLFPEESLQNNLIIFTKEIKPNPKSWLTHGVSMTFYTKQSKSSGPLPKTGNYQENILAQMKAKKLGMYDAFMINELGHVTEGSTSNAWIIKNSTLFTPPLEDGVLEGLTRKAIFEMDQENILTIPLVEKSLTPKDFLEADECFITSTTRNVLPVTQIDEKKIGNGQPGAQTLTVLNKYLDFVK